MRDSTLYIGALASNNVNNIVNDAGKYDEYKEKVKDLTEEIQTRKDTFEKMAEPLVYVCDCYQKFNVVTGMNLFPILRNVVLPCVPIGQVSIRHPEPMKQIIRKS